MVRETRDRIQLESPYLKDFSLEEHKSSVGFKFEPEVFFLGTMSMKPTQYRGASAIYVNVPTEMVGSGSRTDFKSS